MAAKADYCIINMCPELSGKIEVVVHSVKKVQPENILLTIYKMRKEYYPEIYVHSQPVTINISLAIN